MSTETSGSDGADASGVTSILVGTNDLAANDAVQESTESGSVAPHQEAEALALRDLLQGAQSDQGADALGACLSFESVGRSTVISVDPDGSGPSASIPIATLNNVTGMTLQQLLNDCPLPT